MILFLASNPVASKPLVLDDEVRDIQAKIRESEYRNELILKAHWAVQFNDVLLALQEDCPTIVHFSGHGTEQSGLVFHGANGDHKSISGETMKDLLSTLKKNIQIVVLSACHSDNQARAIAKVINCVIGMRAAVNDATARTFSAAFYQALGFGNNVRAAFKLGCNALAAEGVHKADLPQLFCRRGIDASKVIVVGPAANVPRTSAGSGARAGRRHAAAAPAAPAAPAVCESDASFAAAVIDPPRGSTCWGGLPDARPVVDPRIRGHLVELLGIRSDRVALIPNSQNQALRAELRTWAPSHATLTAASNTERALSERHIPAQRADDPIAIKPAIHDLCAFGFETSQPIYRRIAGYKQFDAEQRSEFQGYERHPGPGPFDLPWRSNLGSAADEKDPDNFFITTVQTTGKQKKRRIWSLSRKGNVVRPQFQDGRCIIDYISIVHVPSYFAAHPKHPMTLLAGIQAVGTSAIGALITNRELLDKLEREAPGASAWQAIVKADVHDPASPRFDVMDVARVGVNEDVLAAWRAAPPDF